MIINNTNNHKIIIKIIIKIPSSKFIFLPQRGLHGIESGDILPLES